MIWALVQRLFGTRLFLQNVEHTLHQNEGSIAGQVTTKKLTIDESSVRPVFRMIGVVWLLLNSDCKVGMTMAVVKVIGLVAINEDQAFALAKYLDITEPLLASVGARIVDRFALKSRVVGDGPVRTVIIVEYPDHEAVEKVFQSAEYQSAIPYRDRAFDTYSVHVAA